MHNIFGKPRGHYARRSAVFSAAAFMAVQFIASAAYAQQIGKQGWEPTPRSPSLASQYQFQRDLHGSGGSGMDALTQYITNYNTSSSSIGNYTEVNQALGDGATGTVTQSATQDSSGTQNASTAPMDSFNSNISGQNTNNAGSNAARIEYATGSGQ